MFLYARAAKSNYVSGIAKQHLRQRKIQILNTKASKSLEARKHWIKLQACMPFDAVETLPTDSPFIHYQMSQEVKTVNQLHLSNFLASSPYPQDLALVVGKLYNLIISTCS